MARSWLEVIGSDEYKALNPMEQLKARDEYFNTVVRPNVPQGQEGNAYDEFVQFSNKHTANPARASQVVGRFTELLGEAVKTVADSPIGRTAGVILGAANLAAPVLGANRPISELTQQEYDELPVVSFTGPSKAGAVLANAGRSWWESTTKKGEWGTDYGQYFKNTTGKTIEQSLPENLKWAAPTFEFLGNVFSDPTLPISLTSGLLSGKVPKDFIGKIPDDVVRDLNQLRQMDQTEVREQLVGLLKNRKGYIKWWEDKLPEIAKKTELAQPSVEKVLNAPVERQMLPAAQGFELVGEEKLPWFSTVNTIREKIETIKRNAGGVTAENALRLNEAQDELRKSFSADPVKTVFALTTSDEAAFVARVEGFEKLAQTKTASAKLDLLTDDLVDQHVKILNMLDQRMEKPRQTARAIEKGFLKPEAYTEQMKQQFGLYNKAFQKTQQTLLDNVSSLYSIGDGELNKTIQAKLPLQYRPEVLSMKGTAGSLMGLEVDENGNVTYDVEKGLMGAGAGLVLGSVKPKDWKKVKDILATRPGLTRVASQIGEKVSKPFTLSGAIGKFNQEVFDRVAKIKEFSPEGYKRALDFSTYRDAAQLKFNELVEQFKGVRDNEALMTWYITAHRDLDRARRGIPNPNGVTLAESRLAIREAEDYFSSLGRDPQVLRDALGSFKTWGQKYILDDMVSSGVISNNAAQSIKANNEWYAAFDVLEHLPDDLNDIPMLASKEYFSKANQNVIKAMKGTEKLIDDPITATIRKFGKAQETVARNQVATAIIDDLKQQGLVRPIATSKQEFQIMQNAGMNPVIQGTFTKEFGTVNRFVNGNVERYQVPDYVAEAVKNLTPEFASRYSKGLLALNEVFRKSATTFYAPFAIGQTFVDSLQAFTLAKVYKPWSFGTFAGDYLKGFWNAAKFEAGLNSPLMEEYIKAGGGSGLIGSIRESQVAKKELFKQGLISNVKDIVTSPATLIEKLGSTFEFAPKLGTFSRGLKEGMSPRDAAIMTGDATLFFNRGGTFAKVANLFAPFLNASLIATNNIRKGLVNDTVNTMGKLVTAVMLPAMSAYAWNRINFNKEYNDINQNIKDNYFTLITGVNEKGKANTIVIPKGQLGSLWNAVEYSLDRVLEQKPREAGAFLMDWLSDLSPIPFTREGELAVEATAARLSPPVVKGLIENWANKSTFTGNAIVPRSMERKPVELQYREKTPEVYRELGKRWGVSPLKLQNLASNLFASYGRSGLNPEEMLKGFTGRFVKETGGAMETQAFDFIQKLDDDYNAARAFAQELVKEKQYTAANRLMSEWNVELSKRLREFNEEFKEYDIQERGGLRRDYFFTSRKRGNILKNKKDERSVLERKLQRRRF